ncbi:DUF423 domain-containing protein [Granulibacter bethesdensis]|uniref:Membrane spanning protein n=1 Tax=Granulibacter bethesdensis (strain ATCC BAA-1260 / CGDNIH1) TaxID=391165 RepID=Q0BVT8_GRABC|nr:DUF423 domain-containing protein [Granulibacter bethesdensis]ABI61064.1 putative membrane spanning protein [Granulibacter bethesdensis CGDNIH1]AHJ67154.1 putative membrane spanning protein [Granulibacter bethesdensis]APH50839.1 putative membrane spanning protein [Granulibacter bethesdensis]APH63533.1 putative membrane spanning protein [Granulibacter bethesdensis]
MARVLLTLGGLSGCMAVAMAAIAAHALPDPDTIRLVQTAVQMQGWHAIMMIISALLATHLHTKAGRKIALAAGGAFFVGTVLFCGDLYVLALQGISLSPLAPIGGVTLMLGWFGVAAAGAIGQNTSFTP